MEHLHFHPMTVHFPIALYFFEFFLLCLWHFKKDDSYKKFAFLSFKAGYALMVLAMIAGYVDAGEISPPIRNHFVAAVCVFIIYTARGFYWYKANPAKASYKLILIVGSLLGIILVSVASDLGGRLVYSS